MNLPSYENIRKVLREDRALRVRTARAGKTRPEWPPWTRVAIWSLAVIAGLAMLRGARIVLPEITLAALRFIETPAGVAVAGAAIAGYLLYRTRARADEISYAAGQLAEAIETGEFRVQREPPNVRMTAAGVEIVLTEISCWQIDDMIDFARLSCKRGAYPRQLVRHTPSRSIPEDAQPSAPSPLPPRRA